MGWKCGGCLYWLLGIPVIIWGPLLFWAPWEDGFPGSGHREDAIVRSLEKPFLGHFGRILQPSANEEGENAQLADAAANGGLRRMLGTLGTTGVLNF